MDDFFFFKGMKSSGIKYRYFVINIVILKFYRLVKFLFRKYKKNFSKVWGRVEWMSILVWRLD